MMSLSLRTCWFLILCMFNVNAHAQDNVTYKVRLGGPAANDIPLAIPAALSSGADPQAFTATLRRDLEICGWFL